MTTIAPPDHDDEPCHHLWRWVDWMGAFICTRCHEIDDAA